MKVFYIFLTLFLWTETTRASAIQNEEKRQNSKKVPQKAGKPLSQMEFDKAKSLDINGLNGTSYRAGKLKAGYFERNISGMLKNAVRDSNLRWPNATVPYVISDAYADKARIVVARAMLEYHTKTCIRFVPRTSDQKDYLYIMQDQTCFSYVGRTGGAQKLSMINDCIRYGAFVHELMHAIGFWHEQSRTDRDDYVTIVWDNIPKGFEDEFKKANPDQIQDLDEPYDFDSIMHYPPYTFGVNTSEPTIISKVKGKVFGQEKGFSAGDLRKIKKLYQCQMNVTKGEVAGV